MRRAFFAWLGWAGVLSPLNVVAQVTFVVQPDTVHHQVTVRANDRPLTAYIYPTTLKKPVLYPLHAPSGVVVTRGFPLVPQPNERVDHPHHVGLWFNYGDVNGYDFWNNSEAADPDGRFGTIRHREVVGTADGPRGRLHVTADWITSDNDHLLKEDTRFVFSAWDDNTYLIDRTTTLRATAGAVSLGDNKEGLLGIRVARSLEHPSDEATLLTDVGGAPADSAVVSQAGVTGHYRSSEGIEGTDVWGTRARWMQLSGQIDGRPVAIVVSDHPDNPGFPTYWHARGYGLLAANPLGQAVFSGGEQRLNFVLSEGDSITFQYQVAVHAGEPLSDEQIEEMYSSFVEIEGQ